jgi:O-antigen/teichoic acid export membrane protein
LQQQIIQTLITRAASTFLNFLIALVIARHAGPEVKGEVTLLVTSVWFVTFFSNILGGPVLVYVIPRSKVEELLGPSYVWALLVAVLAFVVLYALPFYNFPVALTVAAIALVTSLLNIHQTVLMAKQQIGRANMLALTVLALQTLGVLLCFYAFNIHDSYAYIYSTLVAHALTMAVSFRFILPYWRSVRFSSICMSEELKALFTHGFQYQLVEILQLLNLRLYFFQLGLQQGNKYLGIYSIGISILESVWLIPRSMATVHYISTANSYEIKKEQERTIQLLAYSSVLCAVALMAIWFVPANVYAYVFGHGFGDVRHSIRYLFPGILVYSLWIVLSSFYFGTGHYKPLVVSSLAGVVALILFSAYLIPQYVMSGAGLAASLSFSIATVVLAAHFVYLRRQ